MRPAPPGLRAAPPEASRPSSWPSRGRRAKHLDGERVLRRGVSGPETLALGSSPGAWGEEDREVPARPARRFIPRCLGRGSPAPSTTTSATVHPQVPGERAANTSLNAQVVGSSPGAWGEGRPQGRTRSASRFIPRCLGRGRTRPSRARRSAVHPQVPGERAASAPQRVEVVGSSPGAWGEGRGAGAVRRGRRFIPRCLGRGLGGAADAVHPQVPGERPALQVLPAAFGGSSPGAWGEATPCSPAEPAGSVHPQVPGERGRVMLRAPHDSGSSPGAWGEGEQPGGSGRPVRFIPRCLGRGRPSRSFRRRSAVHPQVPGERRLHVPRRAGGLGSSPGAWGEGCEHGHQDAALRFIPRCLGRGGHTPRGRASRPVHPQVPGERPTTLTHPQLADGSSPGAWGEVRARPSTCPCPRFIPRCLGRG